MALLELRDLPGDVGPMPTHRLDVFASLVGLMIGHGGLGHQGPERQLVGIVGELHQLLVDDVEFAPQ